MVSRFSLLTMFQPTSLKNCPPKLFTFRIKVPLINSFIDTFLTLQSQPVHLHLHRLLRCTLIAFYYFAHTAADHQSGAKHTGIATTTTTTNWLSNTAANMASTKQKLSAVWHCCCTAREEIKTLSPHERFEHTTDASKHCERFDRAVKNFRRFKSRTGNEGTYTPVSAAANQMA